MKSIFVPSFCRTLKSELIMLTFINNKNTHSHFNLIIIPQETQSNFKTKRSLPLLFLHSIRRVFQFIIIHNCFQKTSLFFIVFGLHVSFIHFSSFVTQFRFLHTTFQNPRSKKIS
uniref:Uncharacterized protein n=1 Tax=Cacopsylla melanoneura TaxID=428564 RepID=A0A8D8WZH9_9HEMI